MGHPDGAHTHGSGGSGLGEVIVVLLAVALLGPAVAAAAAELLHVLVIVAGVIVGVGATSLVGLLTWRWRRPAAARAVPPVRGAVYPLHGPARAAQPLPEPGPAIERPQEVHLHLHGVSAEDVAGMLARDLPQPEVNGQKPPHVP